MAESSPELLAPEARAPKKRRTIIPILGIVLLCAVTSFLGAWMVLATGLVKPDATKTITDNRQTLVSQQSEILSEVYKKVSPSTVSITTRALDTSQRYFMPQIREGAGSGFIISKDGYVVTNKHVVPENTDKITIILANGKQHSNVTVVGRDPSNDIAFLKVGGVNDLTPVTLGDSNQVQPGQQVAAIGNALGLFRNSITSGIISGTGRPVQADDGSGTAIEQLEDMFQTDTAINPGNSGGPLVNLKGEVIGINTAVAQNAEGIGFAIPIGAARGEINSVLKNGKISKAYLGVRYVSLDAEYAEQLDLKTERGALIRGNGSIPGVLPGTPAEKAGLRDGDVILKVGDQDITPESGLATKLAQYNPGDTVDMIVLRDGKEQKISVTFSEHPQS